MKPKKFWGTWKTKVCDSNYVLSNIDGATNVKSASDLFKRYFEKITKSVDEKFNDKMFQKLKKIIPSSTLTNELRNIEGLDRASFNAVLIDIAISKL